ncbi:MAG TPA: hypothetical protein VEF76_06830 [Patescibacteria group bacterium]|nr:hypothetical protein [Patescibacteria group bacterium]
MKKKSLAIAAVVVCVGLAAFALIEAHKIHLEKEKIQARRQMLPKWAALFEEWEEKGADTGWDGIAENELWANFPLVVQQTYPIDSSSEKIALDCQDVGYKYVPNELNPKFTPTKEYPCQFSACGTSHNFGNSGVSISILWCDENKKITWIRGKVGQWVN